MKQYLTFKDGKSDKFWQIEVSGKSFTVTYGKSGAAGQVQTKSFSSEEKCITEARKLLSEKQKKGYVEGDSVKKAKEISSKKDFALSNDFLTLLTSGSKKINDERVRESIASVNWQQEAVKIHDQTIFYWVKISKAAKKSIGIFDVRWDDAATNQAIEFDYEEGNDPDNAMEEGAIRNEMVIDFSSLFENRLKLDSKKASEDFEVVKDIVCLLSTEVIKQSLQSPEFSKVKKKSPYYVMFSKFHDEESEIIFDSEAPAPGSTSFNVEVFRKACSKQDFNALLPLIPELVEVTDKKQRDKLVVEFYEAFTEAGDQAFALLQEYCKVVPQIGHTSTKVSSPFSLDSREISVREAFVACAFATEQDVMRDLAVTLMPDKIDHPTVLFEILKYFARKKNREKVLHYTKQSLFKGQKSLIKKDSAFTEFLTDVDFTEMLDNAAKYM